MTYPHTCKEMAMSTPTRFLLSLALLLLSAAIAWAAPADGQTAGAVIIEDANLRTAPAETAPIITPLRRGTEVVIQVRHKEWVKVVVPGRAEPGWVHSSLIKEQQDVQVAQTDEKKIIAAGQQKIPRKNTPQAQQPARPIQIIGVIDIQQVLNQSLRGRQARARFEEMRGAGQTGQIDRMEQEMISHVIAEIQSIVEKYAMDRGFTHVLNKNSGSVFYNDASFDITNDIIREYDRQAALQQQAP